MIDELAQFARFDTATRRYIVKALDFGMPRGNPLQRWSGSFFELPLNLARADIYQAVPLIRARFAGGKPCERGSEELTAVQRCADFDLKYQEAGHFVAFAFLYERLFGPAVRPWLPSVFTSAATSPGLATDARQAALATITMFDLADDEWAKSIPQFYPDWDGD